MIVLGIESATETVGVAVRARDHKAVVRVEGRRRHTESLAPAIESVLDHCGIALGSLEAIALDVGPGLFTGLRVGIATAKGLAQGLGLGILELSSLELLAAAAFDAGWPGTVVSVVDARRAEVFTAQYARGPQPGELLELRRPGRMEPSRILSELAEAGESEVLVCGDGALRYQALFQGRQQCSVAGSSLGAPDAGIMVELARARLDAGASLRPPSQVAPVYLRDPDTSIKWTQRPLSPGRGG